jgi:hypothetical protein
VSRQEALPHSQWKGSGPETACCSAPSSIRSFTPRKTSSLRAARSAKSISLDHQPIGPHAFDGAGGCALSARAWHRRPGPPCVEPSAGAQAQSDARSRPRTRPGVARPRCAGPETAAAPRLGGASRARPPRAHPDLKDCEPYEVQRSRRPHGYRGRYNGMHLAMLARERESQLRFLLDGNRS